MSRLSGFHGCLDSGAQYARACYAQPLAKFLSLLKSALVGGAVLGLIQPAFAVGDLSFGQGSSSQVVFPKSGQGIYAALLDLDGAKAKPVAAQRGDDALAALEGFARTVAANRRRRRRRWRRPGRTTRSMPNSLISPSVSASSRQSRNEPRVKLAQADNAVDALKDFLRGNGTPAPVAPQAPVARPAGPVVDAHFVGEKVCATCHAGHAESFSKTLMGRIGKTQPGKFACENCHGPGSQHVKLGGGRGVGGIISFRVDDLSRSVSENNAICLACHEKGDRTYWSGSIHEVRNVACTNCHTIMRSVSAKFQLKTVYEPETCFQCHKDKRAQMARSAHMPIREGKMVCSDCHNPHGTANESLLKTATINDTCYKCHAEKRGPFLFEHTPVRVNCLNCHEAHGSINEFMLKVSRPTAVRGVPWLWSYFDRRSEQLSDHGACL